jgi:hypothetical protein
VTTPDDHLTARLAVIVPDVVGAGAAAELRARLAAGWVRYRLLDRGSYAAHADLDEPALVGALTDLAVEATGRALMVIETRALRLIAGDYLLSHHDRVDPAPVVELTLDLSAVAIPGAEIHYRRRGQPFFRVPSRPGALAIVERGPGVACNHGYVSKLQPTAEVVRLVVVLAGRSQGRRSESPCNVDVDAPLDVEVER